MHFGLRKHVATALTLAGGLLASVWGGVTGCATPGVGDPCLPEKVPAGGFSDNETYIETSSVQCQTRVCIVYKLSGDPTLPPGQGGPPAEEVAKRVYCSCRCRSSDPRFAPCKCPGDYTCRQTLELGGPGIQGHYCVKKAG